MAESRVQSIARLAASELGWRVFRNNVGVLRDDRGVPVRFGLANDSKSLNEQIKSGDLIGIRPVLITHDMVGKTIGQFVSIECKHENWRPGEDGARGVAQLNWANLINALGGYAIFTKDGRIV